MTLPHPGHTNTRRLTPERVRPAVRMAAPRGHRGLRPGGTRVHSVCGTKLQGELSFKMNKANSMGLQDRDHPQL